MSNPKEKAYQLWNKYAEANIVTYKGSSYRGLTTEHAKVCALIAVEEMIIQNGELYLNGLDGDYYREKNNFLFEIKNEIEKL